MPVLPPYLHTAFLDVQCFHSNLSIGVFGRKSKEANFSLLLRLPLLKIYCSLIHTWFFYFILPCFSGNLPGSSRMHFQLLSTSWQELFLCKREGRTRCRTLVKVAPLQFVIKAIFFPATFFEKKKSLVKGVEMICLLEVSFRMGGFTVTFTFMWDFPVCVFQS